ncbi:MAG TPA: RNA 2',3'-cyclic phosphodiesterase [Rhodocyclaceae bacterium]|nr:RNA 2',3'-cyclic phosphodiesterase [Rhodocyclaceae bacterium]
MTPAAASGTAGARSGRRRVFFALWPDAVTVDSLDALARSAHAAFSGRRMRRDTLHMTLAFIGEVDASRIADLLAAAGRVPLPEAFSMRIDQVRCWRHNRIVWCGPSAMPAQLEALAASLAGALDAVGFRLEARAFAAHATLLRHADCRRDAPPFDAFDWRVADFVLVESNLTAAGARYSVIGRWPLASMPQR